MINILFTFGSITVLNQYFMKKIIFCTTLCLVILASCGSSKFASGLKRLELGMTKQEVVSLLGNKYKLMGSVNTPDGVLETWKCSDPNYVLGESDDFILNFLNGRLDEWHRDYPVPTPPTRAISTTSANNDK